jgi:hypothetical protein
MVDLTAGESYNLSVEAIKWEHRRLVSRFKDQDIWDHLDTQYFMVSNPSA